MSAVKVVIGPREIGTNDVRLSGYDRKLASARVGHTRTLTNNDFGTFKLFLRLEWP